MQPVPNDGPPPGYDVTTGKPPHPGGEPPAMGANAYSTPASYGQQQGLYPTVVAGPQTNAPPPPPGGAIPGVHYPLQHQMVPGVTQSGITDAHLRRRRTLIAVGFCVTILSIALAGLGVVLRAGILEF